jgi:hypothetical protein
MIRYLLAISFVTPVTANAQNYFENTPFSISKKSESSPPFAGAQHSEQKRMHECAMKGLTFQMAAQWRDARASPQYAFNYIQKAHYGMGDDFIKGAVNLVYFDDRFAGIPGNVLSQTITQSCISPPPKWAPVE